MVKGNTGKKSLHALATKTIAVNRLLAVRNISDNREWDVRIKRKRYQRSKGGIVNISITPFDVLKAPSTAFPSLNFAGDLGENDLVVIKIFQEQARSGSMTPRLDEQNEDDDSSVDEDESNITSMTQSSRRATFKSQDAKEQTSLQSIEYIRKSQKKLMDLRKGIVLKKASLYKNNKVYNIRHYMRLQDFEIIDSSKSNDCIFEYYSHLGGVNKLKVSFSDEQQCYTFTRSIRFLQEAMKKRATTRIQKHISADIPDTPKMYVLDIISAYRLKRANLLQDSSDPYCVVRMTNKEIHRTKQIWNTTAPIWTISNESLALFSATYQDIAVNGLTFEVYDYERVLKNHFLGWANLTFEDFVKNQNKRMEIDLEVNPYIRKKEGKLSIQFREATSDDIKFLKYRKEHFHDVALKENNLHPPSLFDSPSTNKIHYKANLKRVKQNKKGSKQYRISPYPDPMRLRETSWMTKDEIETESLKPSQSWVQVGSGSLGHLFVEIIGCDNLKEYTNLLDMDKIDPFVTLVYEDTHVCSEVVYNCGNPRFMPWTRRAFVFNITSNTSLLYIAVHDHNHSTADGTAGRLTVGFNNLYPNVQYLLYYDLNETSRYNPRVHGGIIKLRISFEWHEHQNPFYDVFNTPQRFHLSCDCNKKLQNAKFAVMGSPNMNRYSVSIIESLIEELLDYINYFLEGPEAFLYILLWRNSHTLRIKDYSVKIPFRSMIFFLKCILIVEKPNMIPSMVCAAIGWFMLLTLENERRHTSPWFRPQSYIQLLQMFFGKSLPIRIKPDKIKSEETKEKTEDNIKVATEKQLEKIGKRFKLYLELSELNQMEFESEDLSTKEKNRLPNLTRYYLWPYQQLLQFICGQVQYLLRILRWQRCFVSFWITSVCFILSFVFMFVPWSILYKWIGRFFVLVFLGPWNIFLDKMFIQNQALVSNKLESRRNQVCENKEKATKLLDFKRYLFGKYTLSMPHSMLPDRFVDRPLPMSSAKPCKAGQSMSDHIGTPQHVLGGKLDVDIIPRSSYVNHEIQRISKSATSGISHADSHISMRYENESLSVGTL